MSSLDQLVLCWGIGGTYLILVDALVRLIPIAWEALVHYPLSPLQIVTLVIWVVGMLY